jgi:hypothetical protein
MIIVFLVLSYRKRKRLIEYDPEDEQQQQQQQKDESLIQEPSSLRYTAMVVSMWISILELSNVNLLRHCGHCKTVSRNRWNWILKEISVVHM